MMDVPSSEELPSIPSDTTLSTTTTTYIINIVNTILTLIDLSMLDAVLQFLILTVKCLVLIVIAIVKTVLVPFGILAPSRKSVAGQTVLITGAGSGIGQLMALEFGKLGARLVLWDINQAGNADTQKKLQQLKVECFAYTVDVSKKEQINSTAKKVQSEVGKVDILINNAGIVSGKKLFECSDEQMERTMAVNTTALMFTAKNFVPRMLDENHGHVVTIASMAGKAGVSGLVDYCASKFGAVGFHESLRSEIIAQEKFGVKTTLICPYYINTGMFDGVQTMSPTLLPILNDTYAADSIVEAILTDSNFLAMPRFCYVILAVAELLPIEVKDLLVEYFGINQTMDHFKGRATEKKGH